MTFHAWDCITISVKGQSDIFLIITNQDKMMNLIKFLIYKLETIDGQRGTAAKLINYLTR